MLKIFKKKNSVYYNIYMTLKLLISQIFWYNTHENIYKTGQDMITVHWLLSIPNLSKSNLYVRWLNLIKCLVLHWICWFLEYVWGGRGIYYITAQPFYILQRNYFIPRILKLNTKFSIVTEKDKKHPYNWNKVEPVSHRFKVF